MDEFTFNTTPNYLTLLRMIFVPIVVGLLMVGDPAWDIAAAVCFGIAGITDYFDGYLARSQKVTTIYGKLMDPLADKFLVVSSLVMLLELGRIPAVAVILLVCRELGIQGLRAMASTEGLSIDSSSGGKWKTTFQMAAIPFLMIKQGFFGLPFILIGTVCLYISLGLSLWTAATYGFGFLKALQLKRKQKKGRS